MAGRRLPFESWIGVAERDMDGEGVLLLFGCVTFRCWFVIVAMVMMSLSVRYSQRLRVVVVKIWTRKSGIRCAKLRLYKVMPNLMIQAADKNHLLFRKHRSGLCDPTDSFDRHRRKQGLEIEIYMFMPLHD